MQPGVHIDYKALRRINPQAARRAVRFAPLTTGLDYLASCGHNIAATARAFGITDRWSMISWLKGTKMTCAMAPEPPNGSRVRPPSLWRKERVLAAKNKTRLGPKRLSLSRAKYDALQIPWGTIRHILRRNRHRLTIPGPRQTHHSPRRPFVDWYAAKPFEVVQMDLKFIRDHKALTKEQMLHLDHYDIPNYQWGALDVNSRCKLIA